MQRDVNIEKLKYNELDDLLNLYNYKEEVKNENNANKITQEQLKQLEGRVPIFIKGLSPIVSNTYRIHNETGAIWEIRKLLRTKGKSTISKINNVKTGKYHQCFSMINYGKIIPYRDVGYGVIKENVQNIRIASDIDMRSLYDKNDQITSVPISYYDSQHRDRENMPIDRKLEIMLNNKRKQRKVSDHDEIIMDIADKDIKFIFYTDYGNNDHSELGALYFQRKYTELSGRTLPIFRYKPGAKDYLIETNFTNQEIINALKSELKYIDLSNLDFFVTFKDEIDQIKESKEIIQKFIDKIIYYKRDDLKEFDRQIYLINPYELINFVKYVGMVKGLSAQEECIKKMFNNIDITIGNFLRQIEDWKQKGTNKTEIALELMAEVKALATDNSLKIFLEPKLKNVTTMLKAVNKYSKYTCDYDNVINTVKENISGHNTEGYSPLTFAIKKGDITMVRMLLENGIDVNAKDSCGRLPITEAVTIGNINLVKLLVKKFNVDINRRDDYGHTAMDLARKKGKFKIKCFLIKNGAICKSTERNISNLLRLGKSLKNKVYKIFMISRKLLERIKKEILICSKLQAKKIYKENYK